MADPASPLSPELLAANQRLYALRAQAQAQRPVEGRAADLAAMPATSSSISAAVTALPVHLGWGSHTLTAVVRRRQQTLVQAQASQAWRAPATAPAPDPESIPAISASEQSDSVILYPDVALAMLRQEQTAPGRLWLLLRHLDTDGRGWLRIDLAREKLTRPDAPLRICGWRQMRNLLRAGEGVFWQRDATRIWLRSTVKVALALDVARLTGRPVELPLDVLTSSIGVVRAHFYASFHSGRASERHPGSKPIARETLARVTGVSRRSQRGYEEIAHVQTQTNYAIGPRLDEETEQELAWKNGQALFTLKDYRGYQGRQRQRYLAWQLPNSYHAPHVTCGRGRQKHLNRQLALARQQDDLCKQRDTGNATLVEEGQATCQRRRYFRQGAGAARAYNRCPQETVYWPGRDCRCARPVVWYALAAREA